MSEETQGERQLVVFELNGESYGVDVASIREIIRMQDIFKVPDTPDFVEGVINLRGKVTPVVDLRRKFKFERKERDKESRIVVADVGGHDLGVVVDAVVEVMRIKAESVEPPSSLLATANGEYLLGIAKLEDKLIILLDLKGFLSAEEVAEVVQEGMEAPAA